MRGGSDGEAVAPTGRLVLVRGLPGSGKSTYARYLVAIGVCDAHFESDQWFMIDGEYRFDAAVRPLNHQRCFEATREALARGESVVVSNTFTQLHEMQPYIDLGYPYQIVKMTGEFPNIHSVPLEAIAAMRARWQELPEPEPARLRL